jgi:UDP:flavonoid glycosyltransferase YjiC (YdhE family)
MKILFASTGGAGHFTPLVPWIDESLRRGHDVLVVGPPGLAATVDQWKFPLRVGASPPAEEVGKIWAQVATMTHDDVGSLVIAEIFCRLNSGAMLPVMRATCEDWMPDLVLRDPTEFASAAAAEEHGIRHLRVGHGLASGEAGSLRIAATPLQDFGPALDKRIAASTYLTLFPEVLDESPFPDTRRYRLPTRRRPASGGLPDWWPGNSDPLVYVTFGTVAPTMPSMVPLYRAVQDAVAGLQVRVLLTVGRELDVAMLGVPPSNVRIERWVDQADVMAHAALVVCHGGAGTTLGALAAGVPLVVFPLFADQAANAACVAHAGAGVGVTARGAAAAQRSIENDDVVSLRTAILQVLGDPGYASASSKIRAAFTDLPLFEDTYAELIPGRPFI